MKGFSGLVFANAVALTAMGCAAPEADAISHRTPRHHSAADADESETTSGPEANANLGSTSTSPTKVTLGTVMSTPVSSKSEGTLKTLFKGHLIGDDKNADEFHGVYRACSNKGAGISRGTLIDATSLALVNVALRQAHLARRGRGHVRASQGVHRHGVSRDASRSESAFGEADSLRDHRDR